MEEGIYFGVGAAVLGLVRTLPGSCTSAMVIGHNPTLEDLAMALLDPQSDHDPCLRRMSYKYPTGGLATLEGPAAWPDLGPGQCRLVSFVRPQDLPGY